MVFGYGRATTGQQRSFKRRRTGKKGYNNFKFNPPTQNRRAISRSPGEIKISDTAINDPAVDGTAVFHLLNGMEDGSAMGERIAQEVKNLTIRLKWTAQTDAAAPQTQHRYMLVWDNQPNATGPGITDILTATDIEAYNNVNTRRRFNILMNKVIDFPSGAAGEGTRKRYLEYSYDIGKKTYYNGGQSGLIGDIVTGALWFVSFGTGAGGSADGSAQGVARLYYYG